MRIPLFLASVPFLVLGACRGRQEAVASAPSDSGAAAVQQSVPAPQQRAGHTYGSATDTVFFLLERTPCFGACPSYRVSIGRNGSATYLGQRFAPREGNFTGQVPANIMGLLVDRAQEIGFFDLQDVYDGPVTDLPSIIIRVNADGRDKKVKGRYQAPGTFKPFAAYADSLLSTVKWTEVPAEP
ncbi:MAG: DUF6438 domain-containing protein [Flavobacteriales bacterium]